MYGAMSDESRMKPLSKLHVDDSTGKYHVKWSNCTDIETQFLRFLMKK